MRLGLTPVVPAVRGVWVLAFAPCQACARHSYAHEVCVGQVAHIESEALRFAAMLDDELQKDEALARIAKVGAGIEVDVQLLIRL